MEFSKTYFRREIRDGFEISEMMKRAWAAELEVLQVVINICNNNEIKYFADWGTLLGAVRHKGFIPWDDDIDICLKREDYNRLIEVLPKELPRGLVIAGMYSDIERLRLAAETTQIRVIADETLINFNDYMKWFHGFPYQRIGIDIFPLDYVNRDDDIAEVQKTMFMQGMYIAYKWEELESNGRLDEYLKKLQKLCNVTFTSGEQLKNDIWKLTDGIASLCYNDEADYITNYAYWVQNSELKLKKEWYDNSMLLAFENIEIAVPKNYDEVLRVLYGDYMKPVRGTSDHDYPFYGNLEPELKKQIKKIGFNGTIDEFCEAVNSGKLSV